MLLAKKKKKREARDEESKKQWNEDLKFSFLLSFIEVFFLLFYKYTF